MILYLISQNLISINADMLRMIKEPAYMQLTNCISFTLFVHEKKL
jgi:hypothetical protein